MTVDFSDPSRSAVGGVTYQILTPIFLQTSFIPTGVVTGQTSGSIRLDLNLGRSAASVGAVKVNMVNPAGHRSNTLEGTF